MKTIYTFNQNMMNGTVILKSECVICATRELAEQTREALISANEKITFPKCVCTKVEENTLYESADEIPILKQ